ncbi:MAG TPA: hypothetical protein V6C52_02650 [Coleofasciculaceae cyanobacterium]|jgi:hypothetical protein
MFRHARERGLLAIPLARQAIVNQAAQDFLLATLKRFGTDDAAVSKTLREVSRLGILNEFNQAVLGAAGNQKNGAGSVLWTSLKMNTPATGWSGPSSLFPAKRPWIFCAPARTPTRLLPASIAATACGDRSWILAWSARPAR